MICPDFLGQDLDPAADPFCVEITCPSLRVNHASACYLRQHRVECCADQVHTVRVDGQRRTDLENIVGGSFASDQDPHLTQAVDRVIGDLGGRCARLAVLNQIDASEKAHPAHIANGIVTVLQRPQPGKQARAGARGIALQILLIDDVQHRAPDPDQNRPL